MPVPKVPAPYPLKEFDRANLVGIVMNDKGLYLDYFKCTYEEWFLNGNEAGSKQNLEVTLKKLGLDLQETIALADTMEERYIENTKQALDFGIFGVPSFSFSNEIFWGDDRLEDAIRLAPQSDTAIELAYSNLNVPQVPNILQVWRNHCLTTIRQLQKLSVL